MTGRILVTGATGFVGTNLTPALGRAGYSVRATARRPVADVRFGDIEWVTQPDLSDPHIDWKPLVEGVDTIVHLAAMADTAAGVPEATYRQVNAEATRRLAIAAAAAGIRHLLFMSSIRAQTGPSGSRIVTEDGAETPDEPYGRSKLEAENAVRESGVPFTILRPVPVYGAGAKGSLATMLALARSPLPLPLGSLSARRSILGVDNLAAAITFCIANATSLNETYIVADPEPFTLPQMIAAIRAGLNRRPGLFPAPHSVLKAALWAIRRAALWEKLEGSLVADAGKLRRAGWNCPVSTEDGLKAVGRARRGT